jgi:hypothetical protein
MAVPITPWRGRSDLMRIFERFAVGGMILFALSGPVAIAQEENDLEVQPTPVVTTRDAAIRRGPSATAPVATMIHASTPLLVIGHSYGWMRVAGPNNMVGWSYQLATRFMNHLWIELPQSFRRENVTGKKPPSGQK